MSRSPKSAAGKPARDRGSDQIVELTSLIETAKILNSSLDYKFILNHIMLASMGKLAVSRTGAVVRSSGTRGEEGLINIGKGITMTDDIVSELFALDLEGSVPAGDVGGSLAAKLTAAGVSRLFSIRTSHRLFGYLFIGKKMLGDEFIQSEIDFVATLCYIAAAAIENAFVFQQYKESNSELQQRVQELQTLFELSKEFNLLIDETRAVRTLEFAVMGQTGARKYAICLVHDSKGRIMVNRLPGIVEADLHPLCSFESPMRLADIAANMPAAASLLEKGAEVVVPFQLQGKTDGLLILGERVSRARYTDSEISFISSLCNLAAMAIDNARLFQESLAKQRLEEELSLAHAIQEKLLPRVMPLFAGCAVGTFHIPTKQVGGDYFDVIKLSEEKLCVAIADVSGKGFPAALLMANLQSAFRALMATDLSLDQIAEQLNSIVFENTDFDRFITFFAAVYDRSQKGLSYINAGHNYPFLMKSDGRAVRLDLGGLMLGVLPSVKYQVGFERIDPGDFLYMFTDGVNEALNESGEQFTEERIGDLLRLNAGLGADETLEVIRTEVASFVGGAPQSDDITQVCVKFN
jgi:phosphoserine phosphatase RsbU/P